MDAARKRRFFDLLVALGVKEIEVGFPSASKTDFDFVPQARRGGADPGRHDDRGADAGAAGADRADVRGDRGRRRARSSTSTTRRPRRSGASSSASTGTGSPSSPCAATGSARSSRRRPAREIVFEYSPESFHGTELDYALEICEAVTAEWGPTPDEKMIVNLPTTVEAFPPNVYADRIEWFSAPLLAPRQRDPLRPPAQRPRHGRRDGRARPDGRRRARRGTLFGNGERTGNVDLVTLALNLLTQGVDPRLDLSQIDEAKRIVEECNELPVHPRHPYAGELVYTAFSGSHQDAIKKGMDAQQRVGLGGLGRAVPADRPEGRRPRLRGDHPRQLAVGEGRRRVPDGDRAPPRAAARAPGRLRPEGAGDHRRARRRADRRRADRGVPTSTTSASSSRYELVSYSH